MSGQGQSIKTNINYNSTSSTLTIDNKYIILDSTNNGIYIQNSNSITDIFAIIWANTTSYKLINNELFTSFDNITTLLNNEFSILKFSPSNISTNFTMFENIEDTKEIRLYELFILTDNTKNTEIETYLLNKYNHNLHTYISFDTMSCVSEYLLFHNILNSFSYMSVGINNDKTLKAINISDNSKSYPNSNLSYFATENNNINILSVPKIAPVNTDKLEICGFQNGIIIPVINITNKTDNTDIECNILSKLTVEGNININGNITTTGNITGNSIIIDSQTNNNEKSIGIKNFNSSNYTYFSVSNSADECKLLLPNKSCKLIGTISDSSDNVKIEDGTLNVLNLTKYSSERTADQGGDLTLINQIPAGSKGGPSLMFKGIWYQDYESDPKVNTALEPYGWRMAEIRATESSGYGGNLRFSTKKGPTVADSTIGPIERMIITSDGNIGIGTDNPLEKLHVDGNIKSTGNLSAENINEFKIGLSAIDNASTLLRNSNVLFNGDYLQINSYGFVKGVNLKENKNAILGSDNTSGIIAGTNITKEVDPNNGNITLDSTVYTVKSPLTISNNNDITLSNLTYFGGAGKILKVNSSNNGFVYAYESDTTYTGGTNISISGTNINLDSTITINSMRVGKDLNMRDNTNVGQINMADGAIYYRNGYKTGTNTYATDTNHYSQYNSLPVDGIRHQGWNGVALGYTNGGPGTALYTNGAVVRLGNGNTVTSDDRIKFNETKIIDALSTINKLVVMEYDKKYNRDLYETQYEEEMEQHLLNDTAKKEYGFIAQDTWNNIPELRFTIDGVDETIPENFDEDGKLIEDCKIRNKNQEGDEFIDRKYLSIDYNNINVLNVRAVQELSELYFLEKSNIKKLEEQIKQQQIIIDKLINSTTFANFKNNI